MNRKLSDWSSIAEIVAAIGVILSLLFVGLQIRDGNRETVAATKQAALELEMRLQSEVALHADTWYKVRNGQELQVGEEATRGIAMYNMLVTVMENRFHQYNSGYLDRPVTEVVETFVSFPIYDAWRVTGAATSRSPEFLKLIDEARASQALDE